jgi:hypothetical protein
MFNQKLYLRVYHIIKTNKSQSIFNFCCSQLEISAFSLRSALRKKQGDWKKYVLPFLIASSIVLRYYYVHEDRQ